jgi:uncharacterized membrane protein
MLKIIFIFISFGMAGCNYSHSKSALTFKESGVGIGSLENIPDGAILSYTQIVNTILQPKCLACHSSTGGNAGGLGLESHDEVVANLASIKAEIVADTMPKNRAKLTVKEKKIMYAWIDAGGPIDGEGIPTPLPRPPVVVLNYENVQREVISPRCLKCHSDAGMNDGDINLETYENVVGSINLIESEIRSGSMPRPRTNPLTLVQKDLILNWIAVGAPK